MLLQFASASLMNHIDNRAKGPYVLKSTGQVGWQLFGGAAVPGLPRTLQNPSPDPPLHKAAALGPAVTNTCLQPA